MAMRKAGPKRKRRVHITMAEEDQAEGLAAALLKLLERRLSSVPDSVIDRVHRAAPAELEAWFDRSIDARALDQVFGPTVNWHPRVRARGRFAGFVKAIAGRHEAWFYAALEEHRAEARTEGTLETLLAAWDADEAESRAEGLAAALLTVVERRLGPVPDSVVDRVSRATSTQLDAWFDRSIDAQTLEQVFGHTEDRGGFAGFGGTAASRREELPIAVRKVMPEKEHRLLATLAEEDRAEARAEGRAEGLVEGRVDALLRLLDRRLGPVPGSIADRVHRAAPAELDTWFDRSIDAQTLDQVFGPTEDQHPHT